MTQQTAARHKRGGLYFEDFVIGELHEHKLTRTVTKSGRYGLRLMRGQFTDAVGTPIWFRAGKRGRITASGCG